LSTQRRRLDWINERRRSIERGNVLRSEAVQRSHFKILAPKLDRDPKKKGTDKYRKKEFLRTWSVEDDTGSEIFDKINTVDSDSGGFQRHGSTSSVGVVGGTVADRHTTDCHQRASSHSGEASYMREKILKH
jgi:hypothetical protein